MKFLLSLLIIVSGSFVQADTSNFTLPEFAIVKPVADNLTGHTWSYKPSSHMDTYVYAANDQKSKVVIRVGNRLSSLFALAQTDAAIDYRNSEVQKGMLLSEKTFWVSTQCECPEQIIHLTALTDTGLKHLNKDIWMQVEILGFKEELEIYKNWMANLRVVKN